MRCTNTFLLLACVSLVSGCGGSDIKLQHITGNATFAGKPIVFGTIEFLPDVERGNKGPAGTAEIANGQFSTRKSGGRGVVSGPHTVRITAYEEIPAANSDETAATNAKPPLFSGYSINVDGFLAEQNFDVPESAKGTDIFKPQQSLPKRNGP